MIFYFFFICAKKLDGRRKLPSTSFFLSWGEMHCVVFNCFTFFVSFFLCFTVQIFYFLFVRNPSFGDAYESIVKIVDKELDRLADLDIPFLQRFRNDIYDILLKDFQKIKYVVEDKKDNEHASELYYLKKELAEIKALVSNYFC